MPKLPKVVPDGHLVPKKDYVVDIYTETSKMIQELLEVATKLLEFSDRWNTAQDNRRQDIANHFDKISECLKSIAEQLSKSEDPCENMAQLQVHAANFPKIIGNVIDQENARILFELLKQIALQTQQDQEIQSIQKAAGTFKGFADFIRLNKPASEPTIPPGSELTKSNAPSSRRVFISTFIGTSAGLTAGWFAGKRKPSVKWKMVSFLIQNNNLILSKAPQMICDRIKEMTNGDFTIELNNKKIDTEEILRKVSNREIECGYSGIYYNPDKYKTLFFGCAIPFGLSPQEQNTWLLYKKNSADEFTFMQGIYRKLGLNVIPFPAAATGSQMGGWFKKEINSVADFNGLTMRIPGLGGEVLRKYFGVTLDKELPSGSIPIDKIAAALEAGTIQAAEWIGPYDDMQLGLHKAARYYYYPGWWEPSTTIDVLVNTDAWAQLPLNYKAIFRSVCFEVQNKILAEYEQKNSEQLLEIRKLEEAGSIKLLRFSNAILEQAQLKTKSLLEFYAGDPIFKEVYSEWSSFKNKIRDWSNLK